MTKKQRKEYRRYRKDRWERKGAGKSKRNAIGKFAEARRLKGEDVA